MSGGSQHALGGSWEPLESRVITYSGSGAWAHAAFSAADTSSWPLRMNPRASPFPPHFSSVWTFPTWHYYYCWQVIITKMFTEADAVFLELASPAFCWSRFWGLLWEVITFERLKETKFSLCQKRMDERKCEWVGEFWYVLTFLLKWPIHSNCPLFMPL